MSFLFQYGSNGKGVCVILLFKSWVLDTKTKFIVGCFGVVFLGLFLEFQMLGNYTNFFQRNCNRSLVVPSKKFTEQKSFSKNIKPSQERYIVYCLSNLQSTYFSVLIILLFGVNVASGYFAMLVNTYYKFQNQI